MEILQDQQEATVCGDDLERDDDSLIEAELVLRAVRSQGR